MTAGREGECIYSAVDGLLFVFVIVFRRILFKVHFALLENVLRLPYVQQTSKVVLMAAPTISTGFSVEGKSAIITGAGSGISYSPLHDQIMHTVRKKVTDPPQGIGFCFAKLLLSKNCNVLIGDLALRPEAQKLVDEYDGKDGKPRAVFLKTNVVIWDELTNLFDVAEEEFGGADIVCEMYRIMTTTFSLAVL